MKTRNITPELSDIPLTWRDCNDRILTEGLNGQWYGQYRCYFGKRRSQHGDCDCKLARKKCPRGFAS